MSAKIASKYAQQVERIELQHQVEALAYRLEETQRRLAYYKAQTESLEATNEKRYVENNDLKRMLKNALREIENKKQLIADLYEDLEAQS